MSYNPYNPKSTLSDELLPLPTTTNGSSTLSVAVLTVVVSPCTVKLPVTTKLSPIVVSDVPCPIVIAVPLIPVPIDTDSLELAVSKII